MLRPTLALSIAILTLGGCSHEHHAADDLGTDGSAASDMTGVSGDGSTAGDGAIVDDGGMPHGLPPSGASITPTGTFWYVRLDGGDATQCDGKADAAYPGTGTAQHCAFKNPYYLWGNDVANETPTWKIAGGDTVFFQDGPFRMGYKGPNASDSWGQCPGDPYGCLMPPIPAGTASVHTKLLGKSFANCTTKTQLFGGYGLGVVIPLSGVQHVDVACLELTDHAQCSKYGTGAMCQKSFPVDDYSDAGITTDKTTADVNLIDLDIHGFTSRGAIGPIGGVINVNHVRMAYNGAAGWDFDDGNGTVSPAGSLVNASYLTIEWNGCNEEYPIAHSYPALSCFDDNSGGYGDGVGTPNTALDFTCDHCDFNHNTQDGLDLLHTSSSNITVTNSYSHSNMGQQFKLGAMDTVTFQNNVALHNCHRMSAAIAGAPSTYNAALSDFCRASGDGYAMSLKPTSQYVFQNNTFVGYGATSYDIGCNGSDCTGAKVTYENNLDVGYASPLDQQLPGLFYLETGVPDSIWAKRDHNLYYNFRGTVCPTMYSNETCVDPQLAVEPTFTQESDLDVVDFHLKTGSPAMGAGVAIPGLTTDIEGKAYADPPNLGAY